MMDGDVARASNPNDDFDIIGDDAQSSPSGGEGTVVSVEVGLVANGDESTASKQHVQEEFMITTVNGENPKISWPKGEGEEEDEHNGALENGEAEDSSAQPKASAEELLDEFGFSLNGGKEDAETNEDGDQKSGEVVEEDHVAPTVSKSEEASVTLDFLGDAQEPEVEGEGAEVAEEGGTASITLAFEVDDQQDGVSKPDNDGEALLDVSDVPSKDQVTDDIPSDDTPKDVTEDDNKGTTIELMLDVSTEDTLEDTPKETTPESAPEEPAEDTTVELVLDVSKEDTVEDTPKDPTPDSAPQEPAEDATVELVLDVSAEGDTQQQESPADTSTDVMLEVSKDETPQDTSADITFDTSVDNSLDISLDKPQESAQEVADDTPQAADETPTPAEPTVENKGAVTLENLDLSFNSEDGSSSDKAKGVTSPLSPTSPKPMISERIGHYQKAVKSESEGYRSGLTRTKSNRLDSSKFSKFESSSSAQSSDSESATPNKRHTFTGKLNMARFSQFEQGSDSTDSNSAPRIKRNTGTRSNSVKYGSQNVVTEKCQVCQKSVYPMEKITADTVVYHKTCFRCGVCKKCLSPGKYAACKGNVFCLPHFKQNFKLKGNYDFTNNPTATSPTPSPASPPQNNGVSDE